MNKKKIIFTFLIIIIIVSIISFIAFNRFNQKQNLDDNNDSTSKLTTSFTNISVQDAYNLIYNQNKDILIIDVPTKGITRYNDTHIENAMWVDDQNFFPIGLETLYGTKKDILIYDDDGDGIGKSYCKKLLNHTYGKIYYLIGGFSAWRAQNYPCWNWN